jgi:F0F1-type ATP synthase assembly protein I
MPGEKRRAKERNLEKKVMYMALSVNWGAMGLGAVIGFLIGWFLFGLLGAVILAIIVMVLIGIIKISEISAGRSVRPHQNDPEDSPCTSLEVVEGYPEKRRPEPGDRNTFSRSSFRMIPPLLQEERHIRE